MKRFCGSFLKNLVVVALATFLIFGSLALIYGILFALVLLVVWVLTTLGSFGMPGILFGIILLIAFLITVDELR
jgi:hypothetical protein